ncbi:c-type cytochrome [Halieaceae bacterium IMCC14734]|uniref:C-type cytochrome n=1 Tax=Candidatus Litorirhabdus singularis TaxID=2518993 RepID=A0ABT3TLH5_9GAMM|nr:PQQ-binding-like beta-propeller repeat protein [Candidatus Litorirhabdus singularis]MCX2983178.1 c-type cytochrome [Candidatus Litorirhabdus singularis]
MSLHSLIFRWHALVLLLLTSAALAAPSATWEVAGGDDGNAKFSTLTQIHRGNVQQLKPVWSYASAKGAELFSSSELQLNPIVIDDILYGRNPLHHVFAINAETGAELWTFDPFAEEEGLLGSYMRGVTYWQHDDDQRLFFNASHNMYALNARTGKLIQGFGDKGVVDLRQGLGREPDKISVYSPSPGVIYGDLIILGSAVTEGEGAAPGDIRAYNVRSGRLVWSFHTIPHPGEFGYDTWPEGAWRSAGGANAWAGLSVDKDNGVVFVPTGSPTPDFDGSQRHGANLFGNSIIALNATTGKRIWHYQAVHHDIWDRDLSSAPTLVNITQNGKTIPALVQASKQGVLYLLDRNTGKPIFPIEEVPVPASDVPGELAYPTQPRVTLPEPFTRQAFTPDQITDISASANAYVTKLYEASQPFAYMRPIGLKPTIFFPGFYGGANWGGGSVNAATGIYFINATETTHRISIGPVQAPAGDRPGFGSFVYRKHCAGCHGVNFEGFYPYAPPLTDLAKRTNKKAAMSTIVRGKGRMMPFGNLPDHERSAVLEYLWQATDSGREQTAGSSSAHKSENETVYMFNGYADFLDDRGYPANKPPWGTLTAVNLNSGKRLWQVPLGEFPQLTAEGIPITGTRNYGGSIATASGLVFIAATPDEKLRAFDQDNGEILWEYQLPAAGYSTPSTYMINGRQYLVVVCSGGKLGTASGDQYLAFALP